MEEADWSREACGVFEWKPSHKLLRSIRSYQRFASRRGAFAFLGRKTALLRHRFWSVVTGACIPVNCKIAGGLLLPHPNGVVIHPRAQIGPNCLIFQQVTIGTRGSSEAPIIGTHVDIGAGAKILGPVTIGDNALIGANAVVTKDVPARHVATGIPAKVRERG